MKTLRHYHDVGLLEPDRVDPSTGYRYYTPAQVPTAQVVRRLRQLGMPIADVRAVLTSAPTDRNRLIAGYLQRLENQLAETRTAVESLRAILERPAGNSAGPPIEHLSVAATSAAAITATVFIPVDRGVRSAGRVQEVVINRHEISVEGPLREYYERFYWDTDDSAQWSTTLCWPVFRADA
ncbi:MerR family transcriptional regulator [Mycobacterium sp. 21AC1]|nr:MerR family transcriptional regulator [Mycobacterium sp. 21AC1]MDV3128549.1 MerR family transcriptional regulator [Mycobacterium sp. 21AC1]